MPQEFLDGLDIGQRTEGWRQQLPGAKHSRGDVLVAECAGEIVGFAVICPSRDPEADTERTGEVAAINLFHATEVPFSNDGNASLV